jgi:hypothetical protein
MSNTVLRIVGAVILLAAVFLSRSGASLSLVRALMIAALACYLTALIRWFMLRRKRTNS